MEDNTMAKTKQELEEIKSRVEELSAVLQELSEDELSTVLGGTGMIASKYYEPDESCAVITMGGHEESCTVAGIYPDESCVYPTP